MLFNQVLGQPSLEIYFINFEAFKFHENDLVYLDAKGVLNAENFFSKPYLVFKAYYYCFAYDIRKHILNLLGIERFIGLANIMHVFLEFLSPVFDQAYTARLAYL